MPKVLTTKEYKEIEAKAKAKKKYQNALTDFMFKIASKLGGGLPTNYFTEKEMIKLEYNFRKKYDANMVLSNLLNDKK
jgi:hypothetical protein